MPSHAITIRDAAYDLIAGLGIIRTIRIVPMFQWQPEEQDAVGVYLLRENADPDGDFEAGEPHFVNTATIGVSILARADDAESLVDASDRYVEPILSALLRTPEFLNLFTGVSGYTRQPSYPTAGSGYIVETRIEMTVAYQERWEPEIDDDYLQTRMTTRFADSPDAPTIVTVVDQAQP